MVKGNSDFAFLYNGIITAATLIIHLQKSDIVKISVQNSKYTSQSSITRKQESLEQLIAHQGQLQTVLEVDMSSFVALSGMSEGFHRFIKMLGLLEPMYLYFLGICCTLYGELTGCVVVSSTLPNSKQYVPSEEREQHCLT